jgi:carbonic anhydrase
VNYTPISAHSALARLREGNDRFVAADRNVDASPERNKPGEHLEGQSPFAIVLGCSDSRVPVELIFDAGIGEIFVVRVAGNIVASPLIGSVEFAAQQFRSRLVVVLGHTGCGAVAATLDILRVPGPAGSGHVNSITDAIRPAVEPLLSDADGGEDLMPEAVRANVRASVAALRQESPTLERMIDYEGLAIVGAEYSLATGAVDFFEGLPVSR